MKAQDRINYTCSSAETFALGHSLAKDLPLAACVLISGPLAAGKTELIKGLCSYFGIEQDHVQSPTYTLHHSYNDLVHHFDLYRLKNSDEFLERGFLDILNEDKLLFIEWPTKVSPKLFEHKNQISITIEIVDNNTRKIIVHGKN